MAALSFVSIADIGLCGCKILVLFVCWSVYLLLKGLQTDCMMILFCHPDCMTILFSVTLSADTAKQHLSSALLVLVASYCLELFTNSITGCHSLAQTMLITCVGYQRSSSYCLELFTNSIRGCHSLARTMVSNHLCRQTKGHLSSAAVQVFCEDATSVAPL